MNTEGICAVCDGLHATVLVDDSDPKNRIFTHAAHQEAYFRRLLSRPMVDQQRGNYEQAEYHGHDDLVEATAP